MTSDTRTGAGTFTYAYDGSGRLARVSEDGVERASYGYDAYERRVILNVVGGQSAHYLYAASGRPLAEHNADTGTATGSISG